MLGARSSIRISVLQPGHTTMGPGNGLSSVMAMCSMTFPAGKIGKSEGVFKSRPGGCGDLRDLMTTCHEVTKSSCNLI